MNGLSTSTNNLAKWLQIGIARTVNSDTPKHANFFGIPEEYSRYDNSRVSVVSIPFDGTSTWIKGADQGPKALLDASQNVELYDIETRSEPYEIGIYTADAILGETPEEVNEKSYKAIKKYLSDDKFVVSLGGEHSISYGPIKAHAEKYKDLTVLQLDAHTDLRESYEGSKFNHACIMARAIELASKTVAVGIRSMDSSELLRAHPDRIFYAEQMYRNSTWVEKALNQLSQNVYITLDLDVFDPAIMPSTGTPEPGGLGWYEALAFIKMVSEHRTLVGADIVELCPSENKAPNFLAAKLLYKLIAYKFFLSKR